MRTYGRIAYGTYWRNTVAGDSKVSDKTLDKLWSNLSGEAQICWEAIAEDVIEKFCARNDIHIPPEED
jgi:hypothetical protein